MDYTYTYNISQTPNDKVDTDRLADEIQKSSIIIAIKYIDTSNTIISIVFKSELSDDDELTLDDIIIHHSGDPMLPLVPIVRAEILTEHVKWIESREATQNLYAAQSIIIDLSTGESEKIVDIAFPFNIALMSGTLRVNEEMVGDNISIEIGPNTLIGALTQSLNIGDSSIYVSPTVIENIKKGYYISMYDLDGDGIDIGQVISIDDTNSCLTLVSPSSVSINAGSYLAMMAKIVPYLYFHDINDIDIGKQIPTGQRIPKGIPIRIHYKNDTLIGKKISFFIEYLY